jgi:hypothetical protein
MDIEPNRTQYDAAELLADDPPHTPLYAGSVLCRGGFDAGGRYRSPRTRFRTPAIAAFQAQLRAAGSPVAHIRADETPHVEYLRMALSEVRARTLRCVDGQTLPGTQVVDGLLSAVLQAVAERRQVEQRSEVRDAVLRAVESGLTRASKLEEFDALAPSWVPPAHADFTSAAT